MARPSSDAGRSIQRRRDRRGRGLRGPLAPAAVPLSRTPSEAFDDLVLDAVEELEAHWAAELADVEFAVEDVPPGAAPTSAGRSRGGRPIGACRSDGWIAGCRAARRWSSSIGARSRRGPPTARIAATWCSRVVAELVAEALGKRSWTRSTRRAERPILEQAQTRCGAALEPASFALGQPAPDAEALVVLEGVLEALAAHLAADADLLGLAGRAALLREERLGVGLRAQRPLLPARLVGQAEDRGQLGFVHAAQVPESGSSTAASAR